MKEEYMSKEEKWRVSLVAGVLRDKDFVGFLDHFSFVCDMTLVRNSSQRSWTEQQIEETVEDLKERGMNVVFDPDQAAVFDGLLENDNLKASASQNPPSSSKRVVLITGSHHTVRDFLEYLSEKETRRR